MGLLANLILKSKGNEAKRLALPFLRSILHLNRSFSKVKTINHCHQFSNALVFLENCFLQLSLRDDYIEKNILKSLESQITQLKSGLLLRSHEIVMIDTSTIKDETSIKFDAPKIVLRGILFYLLSEKKWQKFRDFSSYYERLICREENLISRKELQKMTVKIDSFSKEQLYLYLRVCLKSNFIPKLSYNNLFHQKLDEPFIDYIKFCFLCIQQPIKVLDKLFKLVSIDAFKSFEEVNLSDLQILLLAKKLFNSSNVTLRLLAVNLLVRCKKIESYNLLKMHIKDPSSQVRFSCINGLKKSFKINLLLDENFDGKLILKGANFEEFASNLNMEEKKDLIFKFLKARRDTTKSKKELLIFESNFLKERKQA
ncbi:MAG: hypothetical protein COB02_03835 [Candidatus Cloacimonadota bacterium]|nr:MAG: hypothetical protein COB02_03835 [Candidatus Cloacimonadota bacterium]